MIWLLLVLVTLVGGTGWYLFFRSTKVLFGFDSIFADIMPILDDYSRDLEKLSSGDVLLDHPEVRKFHQRNLLMVSQLKDVVEQIKRIQPPQKEQRLPRPDVE